MFCPNCGDQVPDHMKFCPNCGCKMEGQRGRDQEGAADGKTVEQRGTTEEWEQGKQRPIQEEVPRSSGKIQMRCAHCQGSMTVDEEHQILTCPYCGSQELILDSDYLAAEKVKSRAYQEVEYRKLEQEKEKEAKEEARKDVETFTKSKLAKWSVIFAIICGLVALSMFLTGRVLGGLVALLQVGLFITSWLMGARHIPMPRKGLHVLLAIAGFVLILPFCLVITRLPSDGSSHSSSSGVVSEEKDGNQSDLNDESKALEEEAARKEEQEKAAAEKAAQEAAEAASQETAEQTSAAGIRPEFQQAMDSYEAFMNEYCDFMIRYANSSDALSMLADYYSYLTRYAEVMEDFEALGDQEMSDAEALLYTEVNLRVSQRLLEVVGQ